MNEQLNALVEQLIDQDQLTQAVISQLRKKGSVEYSKLKIAPVQLKKARQYQFTYQIDKQVKHENLTPDETKRNIVELLSIHFRQALFQSKEQDYQVLISKRGEPAILKKAATKTSAKLSHNRQKQYILEEGQKIPFLTELGVMTAEGKVLAAKYDKFRQINRFLEMIDDVFEHLPKGRTIQIIDFGCGKSYLTFALYHYLKVIKQTDISITGLDLKKEVITHCSRLAEKLGYDQLHFQVGDIQDYTDKNQVDMIVTLHACDTATDAALEKAVRWGAAVILSVPCCQHELFKQIESPLLVPMLQHGIVKERFSALATDSVRAQLLELVGYRTQILEFIDMEHTPKNLMIRAVKQERSAEMRQKQARQYWQFKQFLHITPYLENALKDKLDPIFAGLQSEERTGQS